ncbi:Piwi domain-containing protein [Rhizophagus irregularis DAOM 181602=DAOM 197198]|nr:Piwi domain-containing protein [Rhizophagus irregularis DAOM 181602=DAOM 197198]
MQDRREERREERAEPSPGLEFVKGNWHSGFFLTIALHFFISLCNSAPSISALNYLPSVLVFPFLWFNVSFVEIKFCFRFTLQTHGILTESLDIPNDPYVMYTNPQGKITTALNIACHKSLFNKNYLLHIIICILGSTGPIYGEIKRIGDTQLGVPTQCILLKRLARKIGIDQICSNIFLKVNAKLGGQNKRKILFYRDRWFLNSLDEELWQLRHGSW